MQDYEEINSYVKDLSNTISRETFKLLKTHTGSEKITTLLIDSFIRDLISLVILDSLNAYKSKKMSKKQSYEFTHEKFNEIKTAIQNSVADSFTQAFKEFSNMTVDYYCVIRPTPPPVNKEPI